MYRLKSNSSEAAFSLIELLVALSIASILAATAFTNYQRFRLMAYDTTASTQVRDAFLAVQDQSISNESSVNFIFTSQGGEKLPAPLDDFTVNKNVNLTVALINLSLSFGNFQLSYLYHYALGAHQSGCHQYLRLQYELNINGNRSEINLDDKIPLPGASDRCS